MTGPYIPGITPQLGQQGFTEQQKEAILKILTDYIAQGPPSAIVNQLHRNSDKDAQTQAIHHTLGAKRSQASPGDHTHDGGDSIGLADGVVLSGALTLSPTTASVAGVVKQIAQWLTTLGASDATS